MLPYSAAGVCALANLRRRRLAQVDLGSPATRHPALARGPQTALTRAPLLRSSAACIRRHGGLRRLGRVGGLDRQCLRRIAGRRRAFGSEITLLLRQGLGL